MTNSTPTVITNGNGTREWHLNGVLHRTDGPAVEYADGSQEWWVNGALHRIDGPAREYAYGTKWWYLHGKKHRIEGPAVEYADGSKSWWVNGELHHTNGPAIERADGTMEWYLNGKRHRTDGPAFEHPDGYKTWWVDGEQIYVPYTYVLNAAFARGLPILAEAMLEIAKTMGDGETHGEQIGGLKTILHKHWPMHVKEILAKLLSSSDPDIKHLAFSLLGCAARRENNPDGVRL